MHKTSHWEKKRRKQLAKEIAIIIGAVVVALAIVTLLGNAGYTLEPF